MGTLIDFSDPCLRTFLPVLLQDHTTGKNIIWATDPPPCGYIKAKHIRPAYGKGARPVKAHKRITRTREGFRK